MIKITNIQRLQRAKSYLDLLRTIRETFQDSEDVSALFDNSPDEQLEANISPLLARLTKECKTTFADRSCVRQVRKNAKSKNDIKVIISALEKRAAEGTDDYDIIVKMEKEFRFNELWVIERLKRFDFDIAKGNEEKLQVYIEEELEELKKGSSPVSEEYQEVLKLEDEFVEELVLRWDNFVLQVFDELVDIHDNRKKVNKTDFIKKLEFVMEEIEVPFKANEMLLELIKDTGLGPEFIPGKETKSESFQLSVAVVFSHVFADLIIQISDGIRVASKPNARELAKEEVARILNTSKRKVEAFLPIYKEFTEHHITRIINEYYSCDIHIDNFTPSSIAKKLMPLKPFRIHGKRPPKLIK